MGFVWVHVESFLHSVASPFHSFVTTYKHMAQRARTTGSGSLTPWCSPARYIIVKLCTPRMSCHVNNTQTRNLVEWDSCACVLIRTIRGTFLHAVASPPGPSLFETTMVSQPRNHIYIYIYRVPMQYAILSFLTYQEMRI